MATANRLTTAGSGISGVNLGDAGGTETHTLTTAQLASHQHTVPYAPGGSPGGGSGCGGGTGNTGSAGSGNAHQNTQPTVVLNYIIKE
jgi:microcystin-dependent protein